MKFEQSSTSSAVLGTNVESSASSFGLAQSGHMFDILSSSLYSYPIRAVIREPACNARDAHIASGIPTRPIEVKLPTLKDLTFYVKDFGEGLPDSAITKLYTIYGASTKQQSRDQTGGFGLGCKSPFAYVKKRPKECPGFLVRSAHAGVAITYFMYMGDDGAPKHQEMGREDVGPEDTGITVSFQVAKDDIHLFRSEAQTVFSHFDVLPNFVDSDGFEAKKVEYDYEGESFGLLRSGAATASCVSGCVSYPINASEVENLNQVQKALLNVGIMLKMPLGSVMMTPAREQLRYTEHTMNSLRAQLDNAATELKAQMATLIFEGQATMTPWAWRCALHKFYTELPKGIQQLVVVFLPELIEDEVLRKSVHSAMINGYVPLSLPVGRHDERRQVRVPVLDAEGQPTFDEGGMMVQQEMLEDYGAKVFYFNLKDSRKGKGVAKTRVLNGKLYTPRDGRYSDLLFRCTADNKLLIVYSNSPYAEARVRHALLSGMCTTALLFVNQKGGTKEHAKAHAEFLVTQPELVGMPIVGSDTIAYTAASRSGGVRAETERTADNFKIRKGETWAEAVEEVTLPMLRMDGDELEEVMIGELDDSDRFYLICPSETLRNNEASRNKVFWSQEGTELVYPTNGSQGRRAVDIARSLLNQMGGDISGIVFLDSPQQLRRLQLEDNGFKPFWSAFLAWARNYVVPYLRDNMRVEINYTTTVWSDGDAGYADWPKWLLRQTLRHTEEIQDLWNVLENYPNGRQLREHVSAILGVTTAEGAQANNNLAPEDVERQRHLQELAASLVRLHNALNVTVPCVESRNSTRQPSMLGNSLKACWRHMTVLDFNSWRQLFQDAGTRNQAITLFSVLVNVHQNVTEDEVLREVHNRHFGIQHNEAAAAEVAAPVQAAA